MINDSLRDNADDKTGISYTLDGERYLPDLAPPDDPDNNIGRFGRMRLNYLKNHRRVLYLNLLTSGKLISHLHEIDEAANNRMALVGKKMAQLEGVTEQLKAENQMLWVKRMNNIHNRIEETIYDELIYL